MTDKSSEPRQTTDTMAISFSLEENFPTVQKILTEQEQKAIAALPDGSALLVAQSPQNDAMRFLLDKDVVTVGRHPDADIFLDDVTVSRRHATFQQNDDGFELVDQASMNGTYVNGDRVDRLQLKNGAEIQIGKFPFTYYTKLA